MIQIGFEDVETISFFAFALLFVVFEKLRPARPLDFRKAVGWDLLGVVVTVGTVSLLRPYLIHAYGKLPEFAARETLASWPGWLKVALTVVGVDLYIYWIHRALHTRWLWGAHELHHSIEDLYWFSGMRGSILHVALYTLPGAFFAFYVFRFGPVEAACAFSIGTLSQFWTHTNFNPKLGIVAKVLITPQFHRLHHSRDEIRDQNFGNFLTIWDRVFGTYVDPDRYPSHYPLGLGDEHRKTVRSALGL